MVRPAMLRPPGRHAPKVILASASPTRARLLRQAGVAVSAMAAGIDEAEVKAALRAEGAGTEDVAEALAELKARRVRPQQADALVVGADQMLDCGGRWFDKPVDVAAARATLSALRGRAHRLVTSVVLVQRQTRIWHHTDVAELEMRPFGDTFLEAYLAALGDDVLGSVGCYRLEGLGAQLFTRVRGDFFTILGLPLLPLLHQLRLHGVLVE